MMLCERAGRAPARGAVASVPAPIAVPAAARADLKAYLRIEDAAGDATIDRLIAAAIGHGEALTGRLFLIRQVIETAGALPVWRRLRWGEVRAIGSPEMLDADGTAAALAADACAIDIDGAGDGWLLVRAGGAGRVRVTYQAGLAAEWGGVPDPLRQGAIRLAAHLYTHRDARDDGGPPAAVAALWRPWRRMRLR